MAREESTVGLDREAAQEMVEQLENGEILVFTLGPQNAWVVDREDHMDVIRDHGQHTRTTSTPEERVVDYLQDGDWTEHFGQEPKIISVEEAPRSVQEVA